ncbi:hypothetical protein [Kitasatospora griseola]|uniref:hypothetical protein n=1 Tax=Kitasatospora griseola TaxID=2064 RepID=UPI00365A8744
MTPEDRERLEAAIASAARTVPIRLGPNSLAIAQRGDTIALSGGEAAEVGQVVLDTLEAMDVISIPKEQQ